MPVLMDSSNGTYGEGSSTQQHLGSSSSSSSYNGDQWGIPSFQHQQSISMDWTHDEQSILEDGLAKYASESNIIRYAKIAVKLRGKTVRDVALRCRWMTKKEMSKRRKDNDVNARKTKDRKENVNDNCLTRPGCSRLGMMSVSQPHARTTPAFIDNTLTYNIDDNGGSTRQLLQQNAWAFKQISSNIATNKIHENVGLLSQARDNLFKILSNMNEMGPTFKKMPPLPKMNEDLANTILPPPTRFPIQL